MRPEPGLWLASGLLVLLSGGLHLAGAWRALALDRARGRWLWSRFATPRAAAGASGPPIGGRALSATLWSTLPAGLGLAGLVTGLLWQAGTAHAWPGTTAESALLLLAVGALLVVAARLAGAALRAAWPPSEREPDLPGDRLALAGRRATAGLGLLAAGLVVLGALTAPALLQPEAARQAGTWLFGLRSLLVACGLGGWLLVFAGNLPGLWRGRRGRAIVETARGEAAAAARACYPVLTAALLAGAAWELAAHAVPWRAAPAELWLVIAWLLGGAYLALGRSPEARRLGAWPSMALASAGLAAALLSAGATASLFW